MQKYTKQEELDLETPEEPENVEKTTKPTMDSAWNSNAVVVKSNDLLTAKTNLSLNELRIILVAISKIDSKSDEVRGDAVYWVSAKELREIGSERSKAYKYLQSAVKTLYNRSVIRTFGSNGRERDEFRWISKVSYRSGMIGLTFSQEVLPFLTRIRSNFIRYPIKQISELKSVSTLRFFELCVRWRGQIKKMTMDELREILNIASNKLNGDVARIVRECTAKINEAKRIDFFVNCDFVRTGRRFSHVILSVKNRSQTALPSTQYVGERKEVEQAAKLLVGYSDDEWSGLMLSDQQRSYFAAKLSDFQDGGVGMAFARQYIRQSGPAADRMDTWKQWIQDKLSDPDFVYEARVFLYDAGFNPTSARKRK